MRLESIIESNNKILYKKHQKKGSQIENLNFLESF